MNDYDITEGENLVAKMEDLFQSADWKTEKHVPVIECPDEVKADEVFDVGVSTGKEVAHPNKTEHHIRWIQLFFKPEGDKFGYQIGNYEFCAHGESTEGPDIGPAYTNHAVVASLKINTSGELHAMSFCNIHGVWENSKSIKVQEWKLCVMHWERFGSPLNEPTSEAQDQGINGEGNRMGATS